MSSERKTRVDNPQRCIRTRGLLAAMSTLAQWGPQAPLDKVAEIAGCPKASLARVFSSKEELFALALQELDRLAMQALRDEAQRAGNGRAGAIAAASLAASMAIDPHFRGCPINAAGAHLQSHPWAEPIVRAHKRAALEFYAELLAPEVGQGHSVYLAQAICIVSDGVHITASAGMGADCRDAAIRALHALIGPGA